MIFSIVLSSRIHKERAFHLNAFCDLCRLRTNIHICLLKDSLVKYSWGVNIVKLVAEIGCCGKGRVQLFRIYLEQVPTSGFDWGPLWWHLGGQNLATIKICHFAVEFSVWSEIS